MDTNPLLGVLLHAVGGLAAASFYIPYTRVKNWEWESFWLVGGIFSWLISPIIAALILCPNLVGILSNAPLSSLFWTYLFGVLWGVGGLTFGMSVRYLGQSLGFSISLGFCAFFGTLIPPLFLGTILGLMQSLSGVVVLVGLGVCLGGILVCGLAGMRKEKQLSEEEKKASVKEFNFMAGLWLAFFAGIMSACMAFAFTSGDPIAALAVKMGTPSIFSNMPILVVVMLGGLTTNAVWCIYLNVKNKSAANYTTAGSASLPVNYFLCALAGITWYLQFFFYGMGETRMGATFSFSSWTLHMAFIIVFSNLWGLLLKEWKATDRKTHGLLFVGIAVLVISTIIVGYGNYLKG
ncbi:MAG: L-rhamnose/proton symporter RhaT [Candidatus Hydrogenedentes bacterium]|nr:L-rhamnose/proton symporter RhaT [Candidatus Hydrogenedentota bacterium]